MKAKSSRKRGVRYKRVAVAIASHEYAYGRERIKGIIDYYRKHSDWEIHRNELAQPFVAPEDLVGWDGSGVIGEIYTPQDAAILASLPQPVVNTSSSRISQDIHSVSVDNQAIGRLAAEHLMECRLDNFAFVGLTGFSHSAQRYKGFIQGLKAWGGKCSLIQYEARHSPDRDISAELVTPDDLVDALGGLTLPVGIMAATDLVGFVVLEACRRLGLRSPEDVALVGVDNDKMYCHLAYSTMTSIDPSSRQVGFQAAAMLDMLMNGKQPEEVHMLVPPDRIVSRNSTDMTRSEYPEVARALRFIRNRADEIIDVTNVLDVVPVSRRWLEMKFKAEVGHGIYQEIRRVHIERAKELLKTTDWAVQRVARESGFNTVERFDCAFQKLVGMRASKYRITQSEGEG